MHGQSLRIGSCRYGLMCNEHGMVFDDGVTTRISENRYHMTTTTGGACESYVMVRGISSN
jgi:glycine cleavage system aminomethyltransferase T